MLPEPTLSLTLPSLHDGTPLDCRIYMPPSMLAAVSSAPDARTLPRWQGHAAVVAHPYAPLGGNYNDGIVRMITETLLEGQLLSATGTPTSTWQFVVATFNFRGAGRKPSGHTSWTAKPETGDYMTVTGFLYYFVHHLDPYGFKEAGIPAEVAPVFLSAGYSYGSVITRLLPPLPTILAMLARPGLESPAAEVRRRAVRWAAVQNADFAACRAAAETPAHHSGSARLSMGIRVGGGDDHQWRRRSHELSRLAKSPRALKTAMMPKSPISPISPISGDGWHAAASSEHSRHDVGSGLLADEHCHGMTNLMARVRHHRHHSSTGSRSDTQEGDVAQEAKPKDEPETMSAMPDLPRVRPAYLLVSPPIGLATNLLTMFTYPPLTGGIFRRQHNRASASTSSEGGSDNQEDTEGEEENLPSEAKLTSHPTLVVYGDSDGFMSARKMRQWVERMEAAAPVVTGTTKKQFQAVEVPAAGHFWAEGQTQLEMRSAVEGFLAELVVGQESVES